MSYEGASSFVVVTLAGVLVVVALLTGVSLGFLCARRSAQHQHQKVSPILPVSAKRQARADWNGENETMLQILDTLASLRSDIDSQRHGAYYRGGGWDRRRPPLLSQPPRRHGSTNDDTTSEEESDVDPRARHQSRRSSAGGVDDDDDDDDDDGGGGPFVNATRQPSVARTGRGRNRGASSIPSASRPQKKLEPPPAPTSQYPSRRRV